MTRKTVAVILFFLVVSGVTAKKYVFDAVAVSDGVKASDYAVYNELELGDCAIGTVCNGSSGSGPWKVYCSSGCFVLSKGTKATVEPKAVKTKNGAETKVKVCGLFIGPDAPSVCFFGIVSQFEKRDGEK